MTVDEGGDVTRAVSQTFGTQKSLSPPSHQPSNFMMMHLAERCALSRRTLLGEVVLELVDDVGAAHERQGVVVDAHIDAELEVQPVLVRDRR